MLVEAYMIKFFDYHPITENILILTTNYSYWFFESQTKRFIVQLEKIIKYYLQVVRQIVLESEIY